MDITFIEKVSSSVGSRQSFDSFRDFFTWLKTNSKILLDKKQGSAWSPTLFSTGRLQKDAEAVSALVFDFDEEADLSFLQKLEVEHITHSTYTAPGKRAILALSRPVLPSEWELFWIKATDALGFSDKADPVCKNVGRVYFTPASPGPHQPSIAYFPGEVLPVDEFLSKAEDLSLLRKILLKVQRAPQAEAIRLALAGKPMAAEGNRDNTVSALGFYLGKFVVPVSYSPESVAEILRRGLALPGPESQQHWLEVLQRSFVKGRRERQEREEESKTEQGLNQEWAGQLQTRTSLSGDVSVISNTHNAYVILSNEGTWGFRENVLEATLEFRVGEGEFQNFDDVAATRVSNWLQRSYRCNLSKNQVFEQVQAIARNNQYDPLKHFLLSCRWDNKPRLDSFLTEYMGCEEGPLLAVYSRKWLIALVARALQPGCKMDDILTLQGAQGLGKSTAFRLLAEPWFSDSKIVIGDKDSYSLAASSWVHEVAELASLKRADLETMKNFFSSPEDFYRPPWARTHVKRQRRCVFVATTNEDEFLRDETGNRRWWVVRCTKPIQFDKIARDREAILAEAVKAYYSGEQWFLTPEQRQIQEQDLQDHHMGGSAETVGYEQELLNWWKSLGSSAPLAMSAEDVVSKAWNVSIGDAQHDRLIYKAGRVLKRLKFVRTRLTREDGSRYWAWEVPQSWIALRKTG